jgi:hypothetical protein
MTLNDNDIQEFARHVGQGFIIEQRRRPGWRRSETGMSAEISAVVLAKRNGQTAEAS